MTHNTPTPAATSSRIRQAHAPATRRPRGTSRSSRWLTAVEATTIAGVAGGRGFAGAGSNAPGSAEVGLAAAGLIASRSVAAWLGGVAVGARSSSAVLASSRAARTLARPAS
jgi:hypothetical protein